MKLKERVYDVLLDAIDNGISDDAAFAAAVRVSAKVIKYICGFCENHDLALECGSEWLYQSDAGQEDALEIFGYIIDVLEEYSDYEE